MVPLMVGYIGGSRELPRRRAFFISLFFTLGLAVTFMFLGVLAAWLGGLLGGGTRLWYYILAAVCILIGLQMLGVLSFSPPAWLEGARQVVNSRGLVGAFLLGLVSGLVVSQCATPVLAVILTFVMAQRSGLLYGAVLLLLYALGCGLPLVLVGTFTAALKNLRALSQWTFVINKISGVLLILVGFYFLWVA
jgi:cytochrome c-type biogenesis protein